MLPQSAVGFDESQRRIIGKRVLGMLREPEGDRQIPFQEVCAG